MAQADIKVVVEHLVDCATGDISSRVLHGPEAAHVRQIQDYAAEVRGAHTKRAQALSRLRHNARFDPVLQDLLVVLGLE